MKKTSHKSSIIITLFALIFTHSSNAATTKSELQPINFLVLTDIHLAIQTKHKMTIAPVFMNYRNDLDRDNFEKILSNISSEINNNTIAKPNFILLLGDIASHKRLSRRRIIEEEMAVLRSTQQTFATTPILYVFGNNDSLEKNYGRYLPIPQNNVWHHEFLSTGTICKAKKPEYPCLNSPPNGKSYYTAYIADNLKLVALNSVLFSKSRVKNSEAEAENELAWFASEMIDAKKNNDRVMIVMHIPIGNDVMNSFKFMIPSAQDQILKIINEHHDRVVGIFAAHTHMDEFKIIKNADRKIIAAEFITGSLSTSHGNAPTFRSYTINPNNNYFLDYTTYNFTQDNSGALSLHKLYNFRDHYCTNNEITTLQCLENANWRKLKKYYTAGNINYSGIAISPQEMFVDQLIIKN